MIPDPSGIPLTRRELFRRIGRLEQVAGVESFIFDDGQRGAGAPLSDGTRPLFRRRLRPRHGP